MTISDDDLERQRLRRVYESLPKTPHGASYPERHPEILPEWVAAIIENPHERRNVRWDDGEIRTVRKRKRLSTMDCRGSDGRWRVSDHVPGQKNGKAFWRKTLLEPAIDEVVENCSRLIVEYWPETGTLSVCTRKPLGEGFSVTPNLVVFYDPVEEDSPVGFIMHSAETELKPFLDAVFRKANEANGNEPR